MQLLILGSQQPLRLNSQMLRLWGCKCRNRQGSETKADGMQASSPASQKVSRHAADAPWSKAPAVHLPAGGVLMVIQHKVT